MGSRDQVLPYQQFSCLSPNSDSMAYSNALDPHNKIYIYIVIHIYDYSTCERPRPVLKFVRRTSPRSKHVTTKPYCRALHGNNKGFTDDANSFQENNHTGPFVIT